MDNRADQNEASSTRTPIDVLQRLISLFPDFQQQWESPENCFVGGDGSPSYCGIFSEFSAFFRERFGVMPRSALSEFGQFISECMDSSLPELDEAAATCFLENASYESFSPALKRYLSGNALKFFSQFDEAT